MNPVRELKKLAVDLEEADKIYQEAIERHADLWILAREKFPDYPKQTVQETEFIVRNLKEIYPELSDPKIESRMKIIVLEGLI